MRMRMRRRRGRRRRRSTRRRGKTKNNKNKKQKQRRKQKKKEKKKKKKKSSLVFHVHFSNLSNVLHGCLLTLSVFDDVVQQQGILGESLHLRHQQVFELPPSTLRTRFTLLTGRTQEEH